MRQLLTLAIAISTVSALVFSALSLRTANALQEGDSVTFLIREDQIQPQPPSGPHDGLTFTGKPSSTTDVSGCGTGTRPVQQAVLVDISGGKSGMVEDVVVVSETDPIPQGTELTSLTANGSCTLASDGLTYNRYLGTVTRTH